MESSDGGMTIVAANFPAYDFARAVAGDANVTLLLPPGSEAHSYEPTPADVIAIQECSLFIYAGGENEEWATHMIQNLELDPDKAIAMLDVVEPLKEERVEGMEPERGHSHDHGKDCDHDHEDHEEYDEHVWTSPKNAALIVHAICDKLSQICPADASEFAANADRYKKELERLDGEFREVVDNGKRKMLVFADRFPVRYFTEEYGLKYYAAFPGLLRRERGQPKDRSVFDRPGSGGEYPRGVQDRAFQRQDSMRRGGIHRSEGAHLHLLPQPYKGRIPVRGNLHIPHGGKPSESPGGAELIWHF